MTEGGSPRFVFVESNTTGSGRIAVERLLAEGRPVTFLSRRPDRYPFLQDGAPGLEVMAIETHDIEEVASVVGSVADRTGVAALLTFSEYYVETVSDVARRFGLPFLDPECARTCRDKHRLRQVLRDAGLGHPEFRLAREVEEAARAGSELGFPCVVKPPDESSSLGVRRVESVEELIAAVRPLLERLENDRGQRAAGTVLVEQYLDGPEFSVETLTLPGGPPHVIGVTAKHLSRPPLFVEVGHDFPADLPGELETAVVEEAERALDAVGYDFGPAHLELRLTSGGPVTVEINPRLAGGMIPALVEHALGIDLLGAYLDLLQRQPPDLRPNRRHWASVRFLIAPRAGHLKAVQGVEVAEQLPTVKEVTVTRSPGAPTRPAESALDRLGYVITAGPDRAAVLEDADRTIALLRIEIE